MQVFKDNVRVPWPRPGGGMGWRDFQAGRTPESYGLEGDDLERVSDHLKVDDCEGLKEPVVKKGEEPLDLMEAQEMAAELITKHGYNPPDDWDKKKLKAELKKRRKRKQAPGGNEHV